MEASLEYSGSFVSGPGAQRSAFDLCDPEGEVTGRSPTPAVTSWSPLLTFVPAG